ncbi:hypothetical protein LSUE1_G009216 [Lachnellula suecica]|uniref:Uncharacterized protein n=1 Tax=Lachnellula suecica TaxID=602035 RepID=A0A8T9BS99_9HELO|nr:hypothetical protein LSUE1_G009216 [Lachnellula suecica]
MASPQNRLPSLRTAAHHRAAQSVQMRSPEHLSLTTSIASKKDASTAARNFTEPTRHNFAAGATHADIETCLTRAWNTVIDVAASTPHESQGPLVDIVRAVQEQSLTHGGENECTIWGEKMKVWNDMPLFGPTMRGAWNRAAGSSSKNDFSAEQWCNLNAFVARLSSLSESIPAFDFTLYGIWTMRSAFEGTNKGSPADEDAAKVWFIYAKDTIEKLSREEKTFDGKIAQGGDKYKDQEWRGFNSKRLDIWQAAVQ